MTPPLYLQLVVRHCFLRRYETCNYRRSQSCQVSFITRCRGLVSVKEEQSLVKRERGREREKRSLNNLPFATTDPYLITHAHLAADAVLASLVGAIFTPFVSFEEPSGPAGLQWFTVSGRTGCPQILEGEGGRKREVGGRVQLNKQVD